MRSAKTRSIKIRNRSLQLLAVVAMFLVADLAVPGFGEFPNPVFYGKWFLSSTTERLQEGTERVSHIDPTDTRLTLCQGHPQQDSAGETLTTEVPKTITDAQAALRDTLTGKTSVLAVQQLGTPACQLADGTWRWLTDAGLSLDVQVANDGTITDADLTH